MVQKYFLKKQNGLWHMWIHKERYDLGLAPYYTRMTLPVLLIKFRALTESVHNK